MGESIPKKIGEGLLDSEFVIVLLSKHAVESQWVEREWQTKYWEEIEQNRIKVLPALLETCEIPALLKTKKWADFRHDPSAGLKSLVNALKSLHSSSDSKSTKGAV